MNTNDSISKKKKESIICIYNFYVHIVIKATKRKENKNK